MRTASLLALAAGLCLAAGLSADEPPAGFKPLFNGKDLTGWKSSGKADVWKAEDGMIVVTGGGGGYLMTDDEYGDFELRFEYKMPKMGNSGVAIRSPFEGDPAYAGMEVQLIDEGTWKGLSPTQLNGSLYDLVGRDPKTAAPKPAGEWNSMRIVIQGRKAMVETNGEKVVDADLDSFKEKEPKHPGLKRDKGRIGFQSYNHRVEFKNIVLKDLSAK